jgi:hypothetical protein
MPSMEEARLDTAFATPKPQPSFDNEESTILILSQDLKTLTKCG